MYPTLESLGVEKGDIQMPHIISVIFYLFAFLLLLILINLFFIIKLGEKIQILKSDTNLVAKKVKNILKFLGIPLK